MPPGVVTEIVPVLPLAVTAVIELSEVTLKEAAAVPPKLTAVTADDNPPPSNPDPVMVTEVLALPDVGVKELTVGTGIKVKVLVLVAVPPGVTTVTVPVLPLPTMAVIEVLKFTV